MKLTRFYSRPRIACNIFQTHKLDDRLLSLYLKTKRYKIDVNTVIQKLYRYARGKRTYLSQNRDDVAMTFLDKSHQQQDEASGARFKY